MKKGDTPGKQPNKADEVVGAEAEVAQHKIAELETKLQASEEQQRRVLADYKNLVRRTQEEKMKLVKMASLSVIESLLQPFEHLYLAKTQLNDPGLNMVYQQFAQAFESEGLQEIECLGKVFDEATMEVIDKEIVSDPKRDGLVVKVSKRGYTLNGDVIEPAKVIIGVLK